MDTGIKPDFERPLVATRRDFRFHFPVCCPPPNVDAIFVTYGQSLNIGTIDELYYNDAVPYNQKPVAGAWMPNAGVLARGDDWHEYVPLCERKGLPGWPKTVETQASEFAKRILARWNEAGFKDLPRLIVLGDGSGGAPIEKLYPGSFHYARLVLILSRAVNLSLANGRIPTVYALNYVQGEANRSGSHVHTTAQFACALAAMQMRFEADVRRLTGQTEPVPMITHAVSRPNVVAPTALGAVEAARAYPGRIVVANPQYALNHYERGGHPSVEGYRRLGFYAADAAFDLIFGGGSRRMTTIRTAWLHDTRDFRFEVELPSERHKLVRDSSNELVRTDGLGPGGGWILYDKYGYIPIAESHIVPNLIRGIAGTGTGSLILDRDPHEGSLRALYANGSEMYGRGIGGAQIGPRGLFRADHESDPILPDLGSAIHAWVLPAEIR